MPITTGTLTQITQSQRDFMRVYYVSLSFAASIAVNGDDVQLSYTPEIIQLPFPVGIIRARTFYDCKLTDNNGVIYSASTQSSTALLNTIVSDWFGTGTEWAAQDISGLWQVYNATGAEFNAISFSQLQFVTFIPRPLYLGAAPSSLTATYFRAALELEIYKPK